MNQVFTESVVEQAALAWLESFGWSVSGELRVKNVERLIEPTT